MRWPTYLLLVTGLALMAGAGILGYHRFFVERDYVVQYELACDPSVTDCFVLECSGSEDTECETWYFSLGEKTASDLYNSCGESIDGCDAAATCLPSDTYCKMTMCDPVTGSCAGPSLSP